MKKNILKVLCYLVILGSTGCVSSTEIDTKKVKKEQPQGKAYFVQTITPIFNQLVVFSIPKDYKVVYEQTNGPEYIRESVPKRQSAKRWTEMITVTGIKGIALAPFGSLQFFTSLVVGNFSGACPGTYSSLELGNKEISGHNAYAVVSSCGVVKEFGQTYKESALIVTIAGKNDYYTIQWAKRSPASSATKIDKKEWVDRFEQLAPKLCPVVSGEAAPYPSCIAQKS